MDNSLPASSRWMMLVMNVGGDVSAWCIQSVEVLSRLLGRVVMISLHRKQGRARAQEGKVSEPKP
jgi:hypothetical protein